MEYKIVMPSGIVFDFSNMVGAGRLQAQEVEQALQQQGQQGQPGQKSFFHILLQKRRGGIAAGRNCVI